MRKNYPESERGGQNKWWRDGGCVCLDVSTNKHPNAIAVIDKKDASLILDGGGRWVAWSPRKAIYAVRRSGGKTEYLHRVLLNPSAREQVDHVSGDGLDNRRANIRLVSDASNKKNMPLPAHNTSGYLGVSVDRRRGGFVAQIQVNSRCKYLGRFDDLSSAVAARKAAEAKYGFHINHGRAPSLALAPAEK